MDSFQSPPFPTAILASTALLFLSAFIVLVKLRGQGRNSSSSSPNYPPGPTKLPLIGNLHQLIRGGTVPVQHLLRDLSDKYGAVMQLQLGQVPHVVISSAESAKEVLKTHDAVFAQRPAMAAVRTISYDFTDIIFAPYGPYWRQLRKICVHELLGSKRVKSFRAIREEEVSNAIATVKGLVESELNLSSHLLTLTLAMVSRITFGKKYERQQQEFIRAVQEIARILGGFYAPDLFPSLKFLHRVLVNPRTLQRIADEADSILETIIADHRTREPSTQKEEEEEEEDQKADLVDVLLKLQRCGGVDIPLTSDNIKAVILDVFAAGVDTSSAAMEWAMSEMIRNPTVLGKAQEEVRRVFRAKEGVDESLLHELPYLQLVIKETLRLHPPSPLLLPRENAEDCEVSGFWIRAKTRVMVNVWAIARDPKYWKDPLEFRPERFLHNSVDFQGLNFEFLPFGGGRRICPGTVFAMANIELSLATLLYHFNWKLAPGVNPEDLDMTEGFGATSRRKNDLKVIPYLCHP